MSGHFSLRLAKVKGQLTHILETDPPHLEDAYYVDEEVDVPGIGTVTEGMSFCESCAEDIRDVADPSGHEGVGHDSECSLCGQALTFFVGDDWTWNQILAHKANHWPAVVSCEFLYAMELGLARLTMQFEADGCDPITFKDYIKMCEDYIDIYMKNL